MTASTTASYSTATPPGSRAARVTGGRARWASTGLEPAQTPLHQAVITRAGKPCGLFFQIQGPRLLKTYAVWAGEEDRILYYDSTGVRFGETKLSDAPDVRKVAA